MTTCPMAHFRVMFASFSKRDLVLNYSYENEFNLHMNENL